MQAGILGEARCSMDEQGSTLFFKSFMEYTTIMQESQSLISLTIFPLENQ